MDSRKAKGLRFTTNVITPENGEKCLIEMLNATLTDGVKIAFRMGTDGRYLVFLMAPLTTMRPDLVLSGNLKALLNTAANSIARITGA